jgi:hypothetical protein
MNNNERVQRYWQKKKQNEEEVGEVNPELSRVALVRSTSAQRNFCIRYWEKCESSAG